MGETEEDRIGLIHTLSTLPEHPESVPINVLVPVAGTPLATQDPVPALDLVRMVATARITMPDSRIRLSAGRLNLSFAEQALCFMAGANSIFAGDKLLTTPNCGEDQDEHMFGLLGIKPSVETTEVVNG
jgi:biotin synthase